MSALRIKSVRDLNQLVKHGQLSGSIAKQISKRLADVTVKEQINPPAGFISDGRAKSVKEDLLKRASREHFYPLPEYDQQPDPAVLLYRACVARWGRYYEGGLVVNELIIKSPRAFRADIALPKYRIAIEMDGFKFHSSKSAIRRDHDKTEQLSRLGWVVFRVGAKRIFSDLSSFLDSVENLMNHCATGEFVVSMNKPSNGKQSFFSVLHSWVPTLMQKPQEFQLDK